MIHINENRYHSKLKKNMDHRKLTINWYVYIARAFALSIGAALLCAIRYADIPISVYRIVHTIGNNQPGGDEAGFSSVLKRFILFCVNRAARAPTISGIAMKRNGFKLKDFIVHLLV